MNKENFKGRECGSINGEKGQIEAYKNRSTNLGQLGISRALPIREHRLVGPWCFLDRFGPLTFSGGTPMYIPPHPHIGLQTVTWLLEGEVLHRDSINSEALVRPGGVNIMTAGNGIAHAETTPRDNTGKLNGVQLWVALPEKHRKMDPSFENFQEVPSIDLTSGSAHLFAGEYKKQKAPSTFHSDLIGLDLVIHPGATFEMELNTEFEHAALVLSGPCSFEDQVLEKQTLYYLGLGRSCLAIRSEKGSRILLIGGKPFDEKILMWWNFVARTPEEIIQAKTDWEGNNRFGKVRGNYKKSLSVPSLARFADPNPAS